MTEGAGGGGGLYVGSELPSTFTTENCGLLRGTLNGKAMQCAANALSMSRRADMVRCRLRCELQVVRSFD